MFGLGYELCISKNCIFFVELGFGSPGMVVGAPLASGREEQNLFTAQKKSQVYLGIGRVEYLKISS